MFLDQQVRQDDPRMAKVYAHFERNLREIVKSAGTRVILSTVASNVEGFPPFAGKEAEEQFRLGYYEKARDLDTLRFRADSRINEIIRTTAKDSGTGLIDPAVRTRRLDLFFYVREIQIDDV